VDRQVPVVLELAEQFADVLFACGPAPPPLDDGHDETIDKKESGNQNQLNDDDPNPRQAAHDYHGGSRRDHPRQRDQRPASLVAGHLAGILTGATSLHADPIDG
jgi:hypothetical protein